MNVRQYITVNNESIIILAAGGASRFGSVKQLLHYNGKTLIEHVVDEALDTTLNVLVVTGANAEEISTAIHHKNVQIIYNENWHVGMASGIVSGLSAILSLNKKTQHLIISVCDQPFVSATLFQQLIDKNSATKKNIIASAYAGTFGTPVLFTNKYFDALLTLKGDEGAKKLLQQNKDDVSTIDFPQGSIDIDTTKDYKELLGKQKDFHAKVSN